MTASTSTPRAMPAGASASLGSLPGFGGLFRKEVADWLRGRRTWVAFLVSALFMTLAALNSWLQSVLPEDATEGAAAPVFDPMMNLAGSVSAQIFSVVAIFAVMNIIIGERENGTLAWTASKPVSRSAIWLSKWVSSTAILWIVAGILPLVATIVLVVFLYGPLPVMPIVLMAIGMGMSIALFVTVVLAASTVFTSQAAVAGIGLGLMFLPQLLGLFVSPEFLPTSILQWSLMISAGESPSFVPLISWAVTIVALVVISLRQMERMEF